MISAINLKFETEFCHSSIKFFKCPCWSSMIMNLVLLRRTMINPSAVLQQSDISTNEKDLFATYSTHWLVVCCDAAETHLQAGWWKLVEKREQLLHMEQLRWSQELQRTQHNTPINVSQKDRMFMLTVGGPSPKAAAMAGCSKVGWLSPDGRSGLVKSRLLSLLYFTLRVVSLEKLILRVQQPL